jgi:hypothetical protein
VPPEKVVPDYPHDGRAYVFVMYGVIRRQRKADEFVKKYLERHAEDDERRRAAGVFGEFARTNKALGLLG